MIHQLRIEASGLAHALPFLFLRFTASFVQQHGVTCSSLTDSVKDSVIWWNAVVYKVKSILNSTQAKLIGIVKAPLIPKQRHFPAWALSLGLHLVLLLLVGGGFRSADPHDHDSGRRQVGIVLTGPRPNQASRERAVSNRDAAADAISASRAEPSDSSERQTTILPGRGDLAELTLPEPMLPDDSRVAGSGQGLVVDRLMSGVGPSRAILPGLDDAAILEHEAARRAAIEARGPPAKLSIFGSAAATGYRFVFAIDRSGSMGDSGLNVLNAAREELAEKLEPLLPTHQFQIVAYNHQCVYLEVPRWLPATDENKAAVGPFLERLAAFGGSGHDMALRAALALEPDVVFLLSDGGDPYLTDIELTNLRRLAAGRSSIHCIQFGRRPAREPEPFMQRLATQNSGSYVYVDLSAARSTDQGATVFGVN